MVEIGKEKEQKSLGSTPAQSLPSEVLPVLENTRVSI